MDNHNTNEKKKRKKLLLLLLLLLITVTGSLFLFMGGQNTIDIRLSVKTLNFEEGEALPDFKSYLIESEEYDIDDVLIDHDIDMNVPGSYSVEYTITVEDETFTSTLTVTITEKPGPNVSLTTTLSTIEVPLGSAALNYLDYLVFSSDDDSITLTDVTIEQSVNYEVVGSYNVVYRIEVENETISVTLAVQVEDQTSPTLILEDVNPTLGKSQGPFDLTSYISEAFDNYDNVTSNDVLIEESIDYDTPGTYTVTYTLTDASGNQTSKSLTVTILELSRLAAAYANFEYETLTPGSYTKEGLYEIFIATLDNRRTLVVFYDNELIISKQYSEDLNVFFYNITVIDNELYLVEVSADDYSEQLKKYNLSNNDWEVLDTNLFRFFKEFLLYVDPLTSNLMYVDPTGSTNVLVENYTFNSINVYSTMIYDVPSKQFEYHVNPLYDGEYEVWSLSEFVDGRNYVKHLFYNRTTKTLVASETTQNIFSFVYAHDGYISFTSGLNITESTFFVVSMETGEVTYMEPKRHNSYEIGYYKTNDVVNLINVTKESIDGTLKNVIHWLDHTGAIMHEAVVNSENIVGIYFFNDGSVAVQENMLFEFYAPDGTLVENNLSRAFLIEKMLDPHEILLNVDEKPIFGTDTNGVFEYVMNGETVQVDLALDTIDNYPQFKYVSMDADSNILLFLLNSDPVTNPLFYDQLIKYDLTTKESTTIPLENATSYVTNLGTFENIEYKIFQISETEAEFVAVNKLTGEISFQDLSISDVSSGGWIELDATYLRTKVVDNIIYFYNPNMFFQVELGTYSYQSLMDYPDDTYIDMIFKYDEIRNEKVLIIRAYDKILQQTTYSIYEGDLSLGIDQITPITTQLSGYDYIYIFETNEGFKYFSANQIDGFIDIATNEKLGLVFVSYTNYIVTFDESLYESFGDVKLVEMI